MQSRPLVSSGEFVIFLHGCGLLSANSSSASEVYKNSSIFFILKKYILKPNKMISSLRKIVQCLMTPRLYNIHRNGPIENMYQPRKAEEYADTIISIVTAFRDISYYISPFIVMYFYRRGVEYEEISGLLRIVGGFSCFLMVAFLLRGYGRASNPQYMRFIEALNAPKSDMRHYLDNIRKYDFEFHAWPATYVIPYNPNNPCWDRARPFVSKENEHLPVYKQCIVKILAYIAMNTFALRLIYPGSLGLIHYLLKGPLLQGRASLVEEYNGQRVKIVTVDGNSIDTMLVDNRGKTNKGRTLVICSEGNSGFYEIGIMTTPIKARYSVLGWNHPGFAGSTGLPYPRQEHSAIDAVMQYAIQDLKFSTEDIVMFGWSIGGYSAAWAACNYHTKALVLDATFDDLMALALRQMPESWGPLVREVVRTHVDLNVAEMSRHYRGPVHLVRRADDEIICLTPGDISSNRGNNLLVKLIKQRHGLDVEGIEDLLTRYANMPEARRPRPDNVDQASRFILRLIMRYTSDYNSTHCTPLPAEKFDSIVKNMLEAQTN